MKVSKLFRFKSCLNLLSPLKNVVIISIKFLTLTAEPFANLLEKVMKIVYIEAQSELTISIKQQRSGQEFYRENVFKMKNCWRTNLQGSALSILVPG